VQQHARGHLSPCDVWWGSDFTAAGVAKNVDYFCLFLCMFVCLFVRHAFEVRDCAPDFAMKALEYRKYFDAAG